MVPAGIKWKSLFEECKDELTGEANSKDPDTRVWKNIEKSVLKTKSSDIRRRCTRRRGKEEEPIYVTERTDNLNYRDIKEIQSYLTKVCFE